MHGRWSKAKRNYRPVVIRKSAVQKFVDRKRNDYRHYKELNDEQLEVMMLNLPIRPPIWTKLRRHQKACFLLGAESKRFALLNDMGTGKSLVAIALIRYFAKLKQLNSALVLVPMRVNKEEWAREIEKHSPGTRFIVLDGSSQHKWQQLEENPDARMVIETYAGMVRMVCSLVPRKNKKRNKLSPDPKLVKRFVKLFQGLITDEGTVLGRRDNLPRRIARQMVKGDAIYYTLTGTPMGRDPSLLHAQMWLVDGGYTLGETLGLFRAAFFNSKDNFWGGIDHTFDPKKKPLLHRFLAHSSIRYKADEADLPHVVAVPKYVDLDEETQMYADRAKQAVIAAKGNYRETKNAFMRMRQISSGFIGYVDDDAGLKAQFEFKTNPKLELLLSTLEFIDPEDKVVVFHEFHYSTEKIAAALKDLKIGHLQLYGKTKEPGKVLRQFDDDASKQVLLLSNAMGIGLNLQIAKYCLFYESPVSVITRKQCVRRVERQESQHKTIFVYDFITRGTFDQRILDLHKQGSDLFQAIIDGKEKP